MENAKPSSVTNIKRTRISKYYRMPRGSNSLGDKKMKKGGFEYVMFLGDALGKYVEKWIVVLDDNIVASGENLKEVYQKAKEKHPKERLFVMKVPADKIMVL